MTIQRSPIAIALAGATLCGINCSTIDGGIVAFANPPESDDKPSSVVPLSASRAALNSQAQVALARGRQLEAAGSPQLAQEQFRRAITAAPRSVQAPVRHRASALEGRSLGVKVARPCGWSGRPCGWSGGVVVLGGAPMRSVIGSEKSSMNFGSWDR